MLSFPEVHATNKEAAMRRLLLLGVMVLMAGCGSSVNVEQERTNLLAVDREWSQTAKDTEKYVSYFAPDASMYPQGMPVASGTVAIRELAAQMGSMPGFSLEWTATKADVAANGDLGYTAGTYEMSMGGATERGKYVTVWKKQPNGEWKVAEDIGNTDAPQSAAAQHVMVAPSAITWGDGPPSLPPGSRMAVVSGDPSQAQPFVIRAQVPAGYRIAPHWHPTTENLTVLSGTISLGMGEQFDQAAMTDLSAGGYASMPAEMRHYFLAKSAATFQVHGMGPFAVNYVNPADDPSKQK
jgi:ketosteroid isomerase-like protein/quercetin dioxygenase-like cupin family protein